jgi:monofunctional biosynthetic peptidoglycan transglycosylase
MAQNENVLTLFDFQKPGVSPAQWVTDNDDAVGGISESGITFDSGGFCRFSGRVSLEHCGGYASIRTRPLENSLEGYTGIIFLARGDGKKYRFKIASDSIFDNFSHQAVFQTMPGKWTEFRIAFDDFQATLRGEALLGVAPLSSGIIRQIGFLIADGQEGPFALDIQWIKAFR